MTFKEYINEAIHKDGEIQTKDWERMLDLVLSDKNGAGVAKSIKDKNKAIARYVAGVKLESIKLEGNKLEGKTSDIEKFSVFGAFKEKAIALGASEQEISNMINSVEIPSKISDKYKNLKTKRLNDTFVGAISKAIIKMGFDINFIGKGGDAITRSGIDAMQNGRKWTIGYKTEIITPKGTLEFVFDAITDESINVRSAYYVLDKLKDINTGEAYDINNKHIMGQRDFLDMLKDKLKKYK